MPEVTTKRSKAGWTTVAFGDVVRQVKDKVAPDESGLDRYVAGEHMDTDDLRIRRWGEIGDGYLGPAFHMRFKPGHVLYGSRRTYLRKVAVADFEGITANTTYVLEPKEPNVLLPELLPFIMQTEAFSQHSVRESKGSVNPYVNFSDLAWYEFALPPIEEQRRSASALVAAARSVDAWHETLQRLDDALAATVIEVFGLRGFNPFDSRPHKWPLRRGQEVCQTVSGNGEPDTSDSGDALFLKVADFNRNSNHLQMTEAESRFVTADHPTIRVLTAGTVVFPKRGASIFLNKIGVLGTDAALDPNLMGLTPDPDCVRSEYLMWCLKGIGLWRLADTTSVPQLNHKHIKPILLPVPPVDVQDRVCATLAELQSSVAEASRRKAEAGMILRQTLNQALCNSAEDR